MGDTAAKDSSKASSRWSDHYVIFDTSTRTAVSCEDVAREAGKADVLLVGELHDDPVAHHIQYKLFSTLIRGNDAGGQANTIGSHAAVPSTTAAALPAPISGSSRCDLQHGYTNAPNLWTVLHEEPTLITPPQRPSTETPTISTEKQPDSPSAPSTPARRRVEDLDPTQPFRDVSAQTPSFLTACAGVSPALTQGTMSPSYCSAAANTAAAAAVQPMLRSAFASLSTFCGLSPASTQHGVASKQPTSPRHSRNASVASSVSDVKVAVDNGQGNAASLEPPSTPEPASDRFSEARQPHTPQTNRFASHMNAAALAAERAKLEGSSWLWVWNAQDTSAGAEANVVLPPRPAVSHPATPPRGASPAHGAPAHAAPRASPVPAKRSPLGMNKPFSAAARVRSEPAMRKLLEQQEGRGGLADTERALAQGNSLAAVWAAPLSAASDRHQHREHHASPDTQHAREAGDSVWAQLSPASMAPDVARVHGKPVGEAHAPAAEHVCVRPLVLSLEMFERDVQQVLDDYISGDILESDLLRDARPWSNYQDYRSLVEAAREAGVRVLASNAPRRYVSLVGRKGVEGLALLSPASAAWLPPLPPSPASDALRAKVARELQRATDECSAASASKQDAAAAGAPTERSRGLDDECAGGRSEGCAATVPPRFMAAQSLWDATMAHSIAQELHRRPGALLMHVCGKFHMESGLGIPEHLARYAPEARTVSLVTFPVYPCDVPPKGKKSCSGWLKDAFGAPTLAHLSDDDCLPCTKRTMGDVCGLARYLVLTDGTVPRSFTSGSS